ncbi:MAG: hypothetical protein HDR75_01310 [Bacteroides sp.]|nr:hypothetical protein [Bacteroides sp.]
MKKILSLLITIIVVQFSGFAQQTFEREFFKFYVPDADSRLTSCRVYLVANTAGGYLLKIHPNDIWNCKEFNNYARSSVLTNKRLFLKFDNDEVFTLTCNNIKEAKDGFYSGNSGVYQHYIVNSYFPVDDALLSALQNHEIIKVRAELKRGIIDGSLQYNEQSPIIKSKEEFLKSYEYVNEKINDSKLNAKKQEVLKDDPLFGF